MNIRGIAFDLEGTLVDLEKFHHDAHLEVARKAGLNLTLDEAISSLPHFIGGPDSAIMDEIIALSKNSTFSAQELLSMDKELYRKELFEASISPRKNVVSTLKKLIDAGIPIAIGSLTNNDEALYILKQSGLESIFSKEVTILREDVKDVKPAPDVFLKTAERMGISPTEQLVFEDSPNGVKAARTAVSIAIGMPVYDKPETIGALEKAGVWKIFKNWDEINIEEILHELKNKIEPRFPSEQMK